MHTCISTWFPAVYIWLTQVTRQCQLKTSQFPKTIIQPRWRRQCNTQQLSANIHCLYNIGGLLSQVPVMWHEMQIIHCNGRHGSLTPRTRDLKTPKNAQGSCASTDTTHAPTVSRDRKWWRIYGAVSEICDLSHDAWFAICALATDRTQVRDVLKRS